MDFQHIMIAAILIVIPFGLGGAVIMLPLILDEIDDR